MRERYERALMQREADKSEEARDGFWTKIDAAINEAKSCKLDAKRDTKEIRKEKEFMDTGLEGRFDSLFGGWRDLGKRLSAAETERDNASNRAKLIVRNIDETKSMVREARDREYIVREKDGRGISKEITNAGKDMER